MLHVVLSKRIINHFLNKFNLAKQTTDYELTVLIYILCSGAHSSTVQWLALESTNINTERVDLGVHERGGDPP